MKAVIGFLFLEILPLLTQSKEVQISIDGTEPIFNVDWGFPSVAVGIGIINHGVNKALSNKKLLTLAKALGPSYLRVGGAKSDRSHFSKEHEPNDYIRDKSNKKKYVSPTKEQKGILYTGSDFDKLMSFVEGANWELIFGLDRLERKRNNVTWDPTNTIELLKYAKEKKYKVNWELGNEPNAYHRKARFDETANKMARSFFKLKNILKADAWWKKSKIIGPDISGIYRQKNSDLFEKVIQRIGSILHAATFHQYYIDGRTATIENFVDAAILDTVKPMLRKIRNIVRKQDPSLPIWLGETGSAYGGGAKGLSDTYVAGFMWLDKLGLSATNGISNVLRQTLLKANYGMLDNNFDPRPDYWLTLIFKTLVGTRVLNVSNSMSSEIPGYHTKVRIYAHCTNTERTQYPAGSVTLYYLNLLNHSKNLSIIQQSGRNPDKAMLYILTSSPEALNSSYTYLNGRKLQMVDNHTMPTLVPRQVNSGASEEIKLPPMSFGFIVLNDLQLQACLSS